MRGLFVTGTDTGVGKTAVAALFTLGWRGAYWKPVQTGAAAETGDRARVARMTGLSGRRLFPEAYRFPLPLSPHLAAAAAGARIARAGLRPPRPPRPLIVEGAGGLLVPLNERDLMIDLIAWLRLPVLLVARTRLGTINHTLLSCEALARRGLALAGVVMHGAARPATLETVRARTGATVAWLPWLARLTPETLAAAWRQRLAPHFPMPGGAGGARP